VCVCSFLISWNKTQHISFLIIKSMMGSKGASLPKKPAQPKPRKERCVKPGYNPSGPARYVPPSMRAARKAVAAGNCSSFTAPRSLQSLQAMAGEEEEEAKKQEAPWRVYTIAPLLAAGLQALPGWRVASSKGAWRAALKATKREVADFLSRNSPVKVSQAEASWVAVSHTITWNDVGSPATPPTTTDSPCMATPGAHVMLPCSETDQGGGGDGGASWCLRGRVASIASIQSEWEQLTGEHHHVEIDHIDALAARHSVLGGKWLVFVPREQCQRAFQAAACATAEGRLGPLVRCSTLPLTATDSRLPPTSSPLNHVISVWTPDYTDLAEVGRVLWQLRSLGAPFDTFSAPVLRFKADIYSVLGIYRGNAQGITPSRFSSCDWEGSEGEGRGKEVSWGRGVSGGVGGGATGAGGGAEQFRRRKSRGRGRKPPDAKSPKPQQQQK